MDINERLDKLAASADRRNEKLDELINEVREMRKDVENFLSDSKKIKK